MSLAASVAAYVQIRFQHVLALLYKNLLLTIRSRASVFQVIVPSLVLVLIVVLTQVFLVVDGQCSIAPW